MLQCVKMATKRTADEAALDASSSSTTAGTATAAGAYHGYAGYAGTDPAAAAAAAAAYYAAAAASYPTTYGYGAYGTYGTAAGYYGSAAGSAATTGVGVGTYRMPMGPVMPMVPQKTVFDAPEVEPKKDEIDKKCVRAAAGDVWVDKTLAEWDESDFRLFVGDLGPDCTDEVLKRAFEKYPSFQKAKVRALARAATPIRDGGQLLVGACGLASGITGRHGQARGQVARFWLCVVQGPARL